MGSIRLVALTLALLPMAGAAQVYKSVGPDGKVTYTDTPLAGAKQAKSMPGMVAGRESSTAGRPQLEAGLWEISRLMTRDGKAGRPIVGKKCTGPLATMTFWENAASKIGCTYEPTKQVGNVYTQQSACTVMGVPRSSSSTLTVEGRDAYVLEESITGGGKPALTSTTRARRLGDCS